MESYTVYTEYVARGAYTVEANSQDETIDTFSDNFKAYMPIEPDNEGSISKWDANEEVIKVEKLS